MSSGSPTPDETRPADPPAAVEPPAEPTAAAELADTAQAEPQRTEPAAAEPSESAPPAETSAAEAVAPATPPTEEADTAVVSSESQSRPRVQLNPVKDPAQLRPVGSVDAVEQPSVVPTAGADPAAQPPVPSGPVEIPDIDDLDSDIEAQIEAAMSGGGDPAPAVTAPPPDAEGEPAVDESGLPVEGTRLSGTVQSVHDDNVFLDAGLRISAVVPLRQFPGDKQPAVGDTVEVVVEGTDDDESLLLTNLPSGTRRVAGNWDDLAQGQVVECLVTKTNKGGLEITVSNLRGFLPASQIDLGYVGDTEVYVGQKLRVQVTEVNKKKRNLVVSRRALLQAERDAAAGEFWEKLNVGDTYSGTVKTLKDYGAFINIGPVDGFLHIGEISWSRVSHPSDVLTVGQEVDVKVLKIDPDKKRIGLGMRQLSQNPWLLATEKYAADRVVSGRVTRIADFGAFVELEPGIEGLVHVSELAWKRVRAVSDVLSVGQTEEFKVLEVDSNRKRIGLSLKQTQDRPEAAKPERHDEPQEPAPAPRPQAKNLKGGTGTSGSGGLFGNPSDFS